MAESVTHRFSEYLRNNSQPNEDMSASNAIYDATQEGVQVGKAVETEGFRNQDRRSSITSFADLYERAVRNLLNIRPLFESQVDIFGPKSCDANYKAQYGQVSQTRQHKPDRGPQNEDRGPDNGNPEGQNYRHPGTAAPALQMEHLSRGRDRTSSGFFAQALSEHSRFSHNRQNHAYFQQRHMRPSHPDRFQPANGQVGSNYPNSQVASANNSVGNGYSQVGRKGIGNGYEGSHEQRELHEQHERFWNSNHKHKPSMLDDLRYHARLVLSGELAASESHTKKNLEHIKQEVPETDPKETDKDGRDVSNEEETEKSVTLNEKEQLDLIRERIIKENQKLKYRPYSLRSKRNSQKADKKQSKKNKIKKKSKIKNLWKPSTPKEIFLYQFGLMRNLKDVNREIVA